MLICEIYRLKKLAGIIDRDGNKVTDSNEFNVSDTGFEKSQYQKKNNVQPGTDEWFRLWFAKPRLTGEEPMEKKK